MSRMMNCFKRENFQDHRCPKEVTEFLECAQTAVSITTDVANIACNIWVVAAVLLQAHLVKKL
jgi:hypothetical protein